MPAYGFPTTTKSLQPLPPTVDQELLRQAINNIIQELNSSTSLILKSPAGIIFQITVSDTGVVTSTQL